MEQQNQFEISKANINEKSLQQINLLTNSLATKNFLDLAIIESSFTHKKSVESGIQINKLVQANKKEAYKLIMRLIENTAIFYNVNGQTTEQQLVMIAQSIIDKYGYDNIEDIIIALKNGRAGMYGKLFGRFDGEVVLDWIQQSMEAKSEVIEANHHQRKTEALDVHPGVVKKIKQLMNAPKDERIKNVSVAEITNPDPDMILADFEKYKNSLDEGGLMKYHDYFTNPNRKVNFDDEADWIENRITELRVKNSLSQ